MYSTCKKILTNSYQPIKLSHETRFKHQIENRFNSTINSIKILPCIYISPNMLPRQIVCNTGKYAVTTEISQYLQIWNMLSRLKLVNAGKYAVTTEVRNTSKYDVTTEVSQHDKYAVSTEVWQYTGKFAVTTDRFAKRATDAVTTDCMAIRSNMLLQLKFLKRLS